MKTVINYEYTDTFNGAANYCWVKRGTIDTKEGENFSDIAAVRRVKRALGLENVKCRREVYGETIALHPYGSCTVIFIDFHCYGNASENRQ